MQHNQSIAVPSGVVVDARHKVLRNTYLLLALTLVPTGIGAVLGTSLDFGFLRTNPIVTAIATLVLFYGWIFAIERNRDSALGLALLLGFTLFMGLLLGPLLQIALGLSNGGRLVLLAAGGTAATFFALSAVATTTRRDFSFLGNFLMVGVIVIMLAVVANIFFASPMLHLVLCGLFVLLSSMLILYQINAVVNGGETNYISATLSIYVALYNIFVSLLQLLMAFAGERD